MVEEGQRPGRACRRSDSGSGSAARRPRRPPCAWRGWRIRRPAGTTARPRGSGSTSAPRSLAPPVPCRPLATPYPCRLVSTRDRLSVDRPNDSVPGFGRSTEHLVWRCIMARRFLVVAYGAVAYLIFLGAFAYLIGFLANAVVPKGIDDGAAAPAWLAVGVDAALLALFARPAQRHGPAVVQALVDPAGAAGGGAQHLRARDRPGPGPAAWLWRPLPAEVWSVETGWLRAGLWTCTASAGPSWWRAPSPSATSTWSACARCSPGPGAWTTRSPRSAAGRVRARAPPDDGGLPHRVLGDAGHERRAAALRRPRQRVHPPGRAAGGGRLRRWLGDHLRAVRRRGPAVHSPYRQEEAA